MENLILQYILYLGGLVIVLFVFAGIGLAISEILKRKGK